MSDELTRALAKAMLVAKIKAAGDMLTDMFDPLDYCLIVYRRPPKPGDAPTLLTVGATECTDDLIDVLTAAMTFALDTSREGKPLS